LAWSCTDPIGPISSNATITSPSAPVPADFAYSVAADIATIAWSEAVASDGSSVTYDLYFGEDSIPSTPTASNLASASWTPPAALSGAKDFQWKVVAKLPGGQIKASPTWTFMTSGVISDFVARIPDANLRAALATAAGTPWSEGISTADLDAIDVFTADSSSIAIISGIDLCHSLRELHLRFNTITDVSPIKRLVLLERLTLQGNTISDVTALSGLHKLQLLRLHNNPIPYNNLSSIITPENFPDLFALGIRGQMNGVTYITAEQLKTILNRFTDLTNLTIRSFPDITGSVLSTIMTKFSATLDWITISSSNITNAMFMSSIAPLPLLTGMDVSYNALSSVAFSQDGDYLPAWYGTLNYINLEGNTDIDDIDFLWKMYLAGSFQENSAEINIKYMGLDISTGSAALANIEDLIAAGVTVYYEEQE
jgi:hypothetical protein